MAKYFRCWVIVDGTQPTAFRAREAEDLIPTLKQLQRTQPDVSLMWFERGRLWRTPEEAQRALVERRRTPTGRGREWRPGGEHKDPKARPKVPRDEKRALFKKRLISKKTHGGGFPSGDDRRPAGRQRPPSTRPPSDRRPGPEPDRRGPSAGPSARRPPAGGKPSGRPGGPNSSSRRPSSGRPSPSGRPGPGSFRRPPSGPPSSRRPPSGRPGPGRPAGKPPRRRNDK